MARTCYGTCSGTTPALCKSDWDMYCGIGVEIMDVKEFFQQDALNMAWENSASKQTWALNSGPSLNDYRVHQSLSGKLDTWGPRRKKRLSMLDAPRSR